jgi:pyruvate dehydrogenase E1 component alpha subunit
MDYKREDSVVLCFFGDGAIHQGSFHETLNLASVWNLPVIYVCENNRYAMGTAIERVSSEIDFYKLGEPYRIPGVLADGMDVIDCYIKTKEAANRAREERTPTLIEARTYRYKGHSMSDPASYRTKDEVESFKSSDPVLRLKEHLRVSEEEFEMMDKEVRQEVKEAVEFSETSPDPVPEDRFRDVFFDPEGD